MNSVEYSEILKESLSENKKEFLESFLRDTHWNGSIWSEFSAKTKNMWSIPPQLQQTVELQQDQPQETV